MICPNCEYEVKTRSGMCTTCGAQAVKGPEVAAPETTLLEHITPSSPRTVAGMNGQILFDGHSITISRKGFLSVTSQGLKGKKEIPIRSINSIQLKKGGPLFNGFIQFGTASGENTNGLRDAAADENSVVFTYMDNGVFESLKALVSEAMRISANGPLATVPKVDVADQLSKLGDLLDRGLLTTEEFQEQKRLLLGG